jgi:AraC family transcriptional regulator, regulatory protein of adaptative response / DNA-3-methyladenine glycosylase II
VLAIAAQEHKLPDARAQAAQLAEQLGTRVPGLEQLGLTHTFPSPSTLAEADLGRLDLPPRQAVAIGAFACAVTDDEVRLDRSVSLEELIGSITALDGVEPQTAHYLALRLGERDAHPASTLTFQPPPSPAPHTAATLAHPTERWRPWRALAVAHLSPAADSRPSERIRGAA